MGNTALNIHWIYHNRTHTGEVKTTWASGQATEAAAACCSSPCQLWLRVAGAGRLLGVFSGLFVALEGSRCLYPRATSPGVWRKFERPQQLAGRKWSLQHFALKYCGFLQVPVEVWNIFRSQWVDCNYRLRRQVRREGERCGGFKQQKHTKVHNHPNSWLAKAYRYGCQGNKTQLLL